METIKSSNILYTILEPETWSDMQFLARHLVGHIFRGQADASWKLSTSIERQTPDLHEISKFLYNREQWILTQFQRRAHHYIQSPPEFQEYIEWLSIIQHYGGPTRLLDFTYSFYIALFFAIEESKCDSAVWAINSFSLAEKAQYHVGVWEKTETIHEANLKHVDFANKCVTSIDVPKFVLWVEPHRMNERLIAQQGLFLFPCDIKCSFEDNLFSTFNCNSNNFDKIKPQKFNRNTMVGTEFNNYDIVKIIISEKLRYNLLDELKKMNISAATLFPGLDGFARSLKLHLYAHKCNSSLLE